MKERYLRISMHTQHTHWSIAYKHTHTLTHKQTQAYALKRLYHKRLAWNTFECSGMDFEFVDFKWNGSKCANENYMLSALYPLCKTERNILLGQKLSNVQR